MKDKKPMENDFFFVADEFMVCVGSFFVFLLIIVVQKISSAHITKQKIDDFFSIKNNTQPKKKENITKEKVKNCDGIEFSNVLFTQQLTMNLRDLIAVVREFVMGD
jgi:hypothetical protein